MKLFFCSSITALLMGLCGCCASAHAPDKECFGKIASCLEPGGSSYVISADRSAWTAWEQFIKEIEQNIWDSSLADSRKMQMQRLLSQIELSSRLLGLQELDGWGTSSKRLEGSSSLFRNKYRLLLKPDAKGVLWSAFSQNNTDFGFAFSGLPADTYAAGALNLTPAAAAKLLSADATAAKMVNQVCNFFFQMPLADLLDAASGVWRFAIVCDEENNTDDFSGVHAALTIPDKQGKLFSKLASKFKLFSGVQFDQQKKIIKFAPVQGYAITPVICAGHGSFTVYTSPSALLRMTGSRSLLKDSSSFASFLKQAPAVGVAAFYFRNALSDFAPKSVDAVTHKPSWQVVKRLSDGFSSTALAPCGLNEYLLRTLAILPVQFFFDFFAAPDTPPPAPSKVSNAAKAPRRIVKKLTKKPAILQPDCLSGIARAGKIIVSAAGSAKWPAPGIAGLRQLCQAGKLSPAALICPAIKHKSSNRPLSYADCHYLYFGRPAKDSPKTPILIELPFLHRDHLAVFYADGKVEKIHLSGQRSVRRTISYLHTLHSYEEEEFMRLMQLAGEFDKILER